MHRRCNLKPIEDYFVRYRDWIGMKSGSLSMLCLLVPMPSMCLLDLRTPACLSDHVVTVLPSLSVVMC